VAIALALLTCVTTCHDPPSRVRRYKVSDWAQPDCVPGTVQAANYDTGGQGVAYNVASVNGTANSYRPDGVDLEVCSDTGCGYDVGWNIRYMAFAAA
jgi:hypothetical protein